jgi:hypothetical protein
MVVFTETGLLVAVVDKDVDVKYLKEIVPLSC